MLYCEDADVVGEHAIVNGEWKARQEVMPHVLLDNVPSIRSFENYINRFIDTL